MILRPYGYAIWENIQRYMDDEFKATGHENVYMPMFIPESLLQKEKGPCGRFCAGSGLGNPWRQRTVDRTTLRPPPLRKRCSANTSPKSFNRIKICPSSTTNGVRWCAGEKTTRPFLRSLEFLWQEGHTIHATAEEAQAETIQMLNIYAQTCEEFLAIPVLKGKKTDKEKFAGAVSTYTVESLMHDGKSLQCGTSHYFGDGFAKAFEIQYADKEGKLQYVHETSWGVSTRIIGALIMVHGDDSGLVLPPKVAPIQLMIVPIATHKEGVVEKATELKDRLSKIVRTRIDVSDKQPGWKFSEYEMKGVPLRLEVGPKDIEKNQVVLVRRDSREKTVVSMDEIETRVPQLLNEIHDALLAKARAAQEAKTCTAASVEELKEVLDRQPGFVKAMWCGDQACEDKVKEVATATSRCIPFEQEKVSDTCLCCGKPSDIMVVWGRAY